MTTYRLTCIIRTPAGGVFAEVVHVESQIELTTAADGERVALEFLGPQRGFYSEIRVEPVPYFAGPVAEPPPAQTPLLAVGCNVASAATVDMLSDEL